MRCKCNLPEAMKGDMFIKVLIVLDGLVVMLYFKFLSPFYKLEMPHLIPQIMYTIDFEAPGLQIQ